MKLHLTGEVVEKREGRVHFRLLTTFVPSTEMLRELQTNLGFPFKLHGGPWEVMTGPGTEIKSRLLNVIVTKWCCSENAADSKLF